MVRKNRKKYFYPPLIAHRGAGKAAPENTMAAFKYGYAQGFKMHECDVKLSADKELFLLHDADLSRTTDGSGLAKEKSWQALSKMDAGSWHSSFYKGEPLVHFESLVDFVFDHKMQLDVEVKPNKGEAYETGKAVATMLKRKKKERIDIYVDLIFKEDGAQFFEHLYNRLYSELLESPTIYCVKKQFLISSFDPESLRGAYDHVPQIPRALLVDDWSLGEDHIWKTLDSLQCAGIITNYEILTDEFIAKCHQAGRFVMVYTANEYDEITRLLERGVDSVITDNMQATHYFQESL